MLFYGSTGDVVAIWNTVWGGLGASSYLDYLSRGMVIISRQLQKKLSFSGVLVAKKSAVIDKKTRTWMSIIGISRPYAILSLL